MYEEIFRSHARPFRATPDARFYFPSGNAEHARQAAIRAVQRAEGPVLILGSAGLGKSLLANKIGEDLSADFDIVRLSAANLSSRTDLLQAILYELGLPYQGLPEGELRLAILDRLEPGPEQKNGGILVLVDEAHTLQSLLLDELRLLSNFTRDHSPRVRLVLFGNLQLEEAFAKPELESLNQRLAARCYLSPMSREETREYIRHQLRIAEIEPDQFITFDAIEGVYAGSEGVPRIANQLIDHAIILAFAQSRTPVDGRLVEEAWAELQQFPAPWDAPVPPATKVTHQPSGSQPQESSTESAQDCQEENVVVCESQANTVESDSTSEETEPSCIPGSTCSVAPSEADYTEMPQLAPSEGQETVEVSLNSADDLARIADEISNVQRTTYEVEFGELADETCEAKLPEQTEVGSSKATTDGSLKENEIAESEVNFFSAFTPPEAGELPESVQAALSDTSMTTQADTCKNQESTSDEKQLDVSELLDANSSVNCSQAAEDGAAPENPTVDVLPPDSFFESRPTDEQMLAFEEEQAAYDAMGVWENDPPGITIYSQDQEPWNNPAFREELERELGQLPDSTAPEAETPRQEPVENAAEQPPTPTGSDLFGADFEEELSLEELTNNSRSRETLEVDPAPVALSADSEETTSAGEGCFAASQPTSIDTCDGASCSQLEHSAAEVGTDPALDCSDSTTPDLEESVLSSQPQDAISESSQSPKEDLIPANEANEEATAKRETNGQNSSEMYDVYTVQWDQDGLEAFTSGVGDPNSWSVDVVPIDADYELAIQKQLDEMSMQLNFSGIQTPEATEVIAQDAKPNSAHEGTESGVDSDQPLDSQQASQIPPSPTNLDTAEEFFARGAAEYDDDRDLLVLEDDLPAMLQEASQKEQKPKVPVKRKSYTQLFAKLRR